MNRIIKQHELYKNIIQSLWDDMEITDMVSERGRYRLQKARSFLQSAIFNLDNAVKYEAKHHEEALTGKKSTNIEIEEDDTDTTDNE